MYVSVFRDAAPRVSYGRVWCLVAIWCSWCHLVVSVCCLLCLVVVDLLTVPGRPMVSVIVPVCVYGCRVVPLGGLPLPTHVHG